MTGSRRDTTHFDDLVDGTPGNDRADAGERDTQLTTDDDAQRDDATAQPDTASE